MQDWPALRAETDCLWRALRDALREAGETAPDSLDRSRPPLDVWTDPGLVLSQTCGLPFARHLFGRVTLIGAFDHGLPGTPAGWYHSVLVVRDDDRRTALREFRGSVAAVNETGSQSGHGALAVVVAPAAGRNGSFFRRSVVTGAHRASAEAVRTGRADIAAIDAVSWRHMCAHDGAGPGLRILMRTAPTPGLPLIGRKGADPARLRNAVSSALAALDPTILDRLGIAGVVVMQPEDYAPLATRLAGLPADRLIPPEADGSHPQA